MKKIILIFLFGILLFNNCSKSKENNGKEAFIGNEIENIDDVFTEITVNQVNQSEINYFEVDDGCYIIFHDNNIYFVNENEKKYTVLPESSYYLGTDGFHRLRISRSVTGLNTDEMTLIGGKYFQDIFFQSKHDGAKDWSNFEEHDEWDSYYYGSVKKISSSRYFSEYVNGKRIEYRPENLYTTYGVFCKCHPYSWNVNSITWVVGEPDEGIGAYIEIEYNYPITILSVLNGFVDINNSKLFKENNRPSVLTIIDIENNYEFDINIPDYVHFSDIVFQKETRHIKLIIKDVHRGNKYNDTCITALVNGRNDGNYLERYYWEILNKAISEYRRF
jgi:hypothetical protein